MRRRRTFSCPRPRDGEPLLRATTIPPAARSSPRGSRSRSTALSAAACIRTCSSPTAASAELTWPSTLISPPISSTCRKWDRASAAQRASVSRAFASLSPSQGELTLAYEHPQLRHAICVTIAADCEVANEANALRVFLHLEPQLRQRISIDVAPVFLGERFSPWFGVDGEPTSHFPGLSRSAEVARGRFRAGGVERARAGRLDSSGDRHLFLAAARGRPRRDFHPHRWHPEIFRSFRTRQPGRGHPVAWAQPFDAEWRAARGRRVDGDSGGRSLRRRTRQSPASEGARAACASGRDAVRALLRRLFRSGLLSHRRCDPFRRERRPARLRRTFAAGVEATLAWMDRYGDIDGDGFYEYRTRAKDGLKNQGWKDSGQAILYPDGSYVRDPIAVAEVQGLFYAAKQAIACLFAEFGESERAAQLFSEAAMLKQRFNERFWMPDLGFIALALDPDKKQVRTIASNAGLCLASGIIDDDKTTRGRRSPDASRHVQRLGHPNPVERASGFQSVFLSPGLGLAGVERPRLRRLQALRVQRCSSIGSPRRRSTRPSLFDFDRLPEVFGGHDRGRLDGLIRVFTRRLLAAGVVGLGDHPDLPHDNRRHDLRAAENPRDRSGPARVAARSRTSRLTDRRGPCVDRPAQDTRTATRTTKSPRARKAGASFVSIPAGRDRTASLWLWSKPSGPFRLLRRAPEGFTRAYSSTRQPRAGRANSSAMSRAFKPRARAGAVASGAGDAPAPPGSIRN